jgi:hypothetical protein
MKAVNVQKVQRIRPATSVVNQVTSLVIAPTQPPRELVVKVDTVVDSHQADLRSATRYIPHMNLQDHSDNV